MVDSYVELLVKRNVEKEKQLRKKCMAVIIIAVIMIATFAKMPVLYCLLLPVILSFHSMVLKYYVEFEYYYMDGELSISKIYNRARRKEILTLTDGAIKLIAPMDSAELQEFENLKEIDCTANEPLNIPYVIVYEDKGKLKALNIQMNDELFKELKRNMLNKVKCN